MKSIGIDEKGSARWYAIETRAKSERQAHDEIHKLDLDAYLPEYEIERFNRRMRKRIITRLCHFPRYLFVQMRPADFGRVLACRGVSDILPGLPLNPQPVQAKDVLELRTAQQAHLFDDTDHARRLRGETVKNTLAAMRKRLADKPGVRVTSGPFMGHQGEVEAVHSLTRLRATLNLFGRATPVELEVEQIEELAA